MPFHRGARGRRREEGFVVPTKVGNQIFLDPGFRRGDGSSAISAVSAVSDLLLSRVKAFPHASECLPPRGDFS